MKTEDDAVNEKPERRARWFAPRNGGYSAGDYDGRRDQNHNGAEHPKPPKGRAGVSSAEEAKSR